MKKIPLEDRTAKFDIALSFAGEDRAYVARVANYLVENGILVFFDDFYRVDLLGKELVTWLRHIYGERSKYCAVFISQHYRRKRWPNTVERQSILDRATQADDDYVLPVVLDDSWLDGLPTTIGFIDARKHSEEEVGQAIVDKCGGIRAQLNEETIFRVLASDDAFTGRFIWLFGQRDEFWYDHYERPNETIRKADACASLLKTYGLCKYDTNYPLEDKDIYVSASLTDRGKRFREFFAKWLLPQSRIDFSAEKLIHSLMMLVPLRSRLWDSLPEKERNTLTYSVEDLSKATIDYCLSKPSALDFATHKERLQSFFHSIQNAHSREDVIATFAAIKETKPYWCTPYFDSGDLMVLKLAREKIEKEAQQTDAPDKK